MLLSSRHRGVICHYDFSEDALSQDHILPICRSNYTESYGYNYNIGLVVPYDRLSGSHPPHWHAVLQTASGLSVLLIGQQKLSPLTSYYSPNRIILLVSFLSSSSNYAFWKCNISVYIICKYCRGICNLQCRIELARCCTGSQPFKSLL